MINAIRKINTLLFGVGFVNRYPPKITINEKKNCRFLYTNAPPINIYIKTKPLANYNIWSNLFVLPLQFSQLPPQLSFEVELQ